MTQTGNLAGRKEWTALFVLLLPLLLVSMDISVLFFATPAIAADLAPSSTQQLWIFDAYGFVLAGLLITMGSLGDRIGRRKLLLFGAGIFGIASLMAAFADNPEMLIAGRVLLGVGGAALLPSTLALIRNLFQDDKQRAKAVAAWSGAMTSGAALGPVLCGVMLNYFWWGSVFLINIPVMVALLVLAPVLVPEYKHPQPGRYDLAGALLLFAAMLPIIWGIKDSSANGAGAVPTAGIVLGAVAALLFVRRQATVAEPMIDLKLFRHRAFSGSIALSVVAKWAMIGISVFSTQYLILVIGMTPLKAALWSLLPIIPIFVAISVATVLSHKIDRAYIVCGGFLLMAGGLLVVTQAKADSGLWVILVGTAAIGAGIATVVPLLTDMVITSAPPEKAGAASATLETGQEFGAALGMAALGTIGLAVYRGSVEDKMPADVPPAALEAVRETMAGAAATAAQLPGELGTSVLQGARVAFSSGMHTAALVAACLVILSAGAALTVLRGLKRPSEIAAEAAAAKEAAAAAPVPGEPVTVAAVAPEALPGVGAGIPAASDR
ncbi:MFS transporter [Streptomyces sp. E11-3]|uniref:MFS transporter n=1 Tax=Streptomyces sp. E11-3 TaxID=3110112 RepID=UPI003980E4C1